MFARLIAAAAATALLATAAQAAPTETSVEVQGPGGLLRGTMLTPEGATQAPVMLLIPGSGPTDRDGNNPLGVVGSPYRRLVEALAAEGVATVRVDKRGQFGSAQATFDQTGPTVEAYAADVRAWAAHIRDLTGRDCIWLGAHSEGVLMVLAAAQDLDGVCGLVLIAGGGRRLTDVIREQITSNPANPPEVLEQTERALKAIEAGQRFDASSFHPALQPLFGPHAQSFLINVSRYDPADLVKGYRGPVLVVQGATDVQVLVKDAERLAGARPGVELAVIEGMNHVLRIAPADRAANIASYADPAAPLAPGVAEAIAAFVKAPR